MTEACQLRTSMWLLLRFVAVAFLLSIAPSAIQGQLSSSFYSTSCSSLQSTVQSAFNTELQGDGRVGASLLRMFFHDCFVQGCDGSVLLDDTANFTGEKTAGPNVNSLRGFTSVDNIKAAVENVCPGVVSCADLLALIALNAVGAAGGPSWTVEFGRLDSTTASLSLANTNLPSPNSNSATLTTSFTNQGLSQLDMVTLSGAHTFGKAQCGNLDPRLYNFGGSGAADPTMNTTYLATVQGECPQSGPTTTTVDLDQATPTAFDNAFYTNLLTGTGLLQSDQTLQSDGGSTASTVNSFSNSQSAFFTQWQSSIVSMGRLGAGNPGQVRTNCRVVNSS